MKKILVVLALVGIMAPAANAIPHLQIYIEGATYDAGWDSWIISDNSFVLWVAGDVYKDGTIFDVKLAASMYGTSGSMTISPTQTALVTDPSTPIGPTDLGSDETQFSGTAFDQIDSHAEYASADAHNFWDLGDFSLMDSPIYDFPVTPWVDSEAGQINAYNVTVTGWDAVHFDAFDHTVSTNPAGVEKVKYWFAPPSHDGTGGGDGVIPEPGTLGLLGLGLAGLGFRIRRRK